MRARRKRVWAKAAVLGTIGGAIVGAALFFAWDRLASEWINVIEEWLSWPLPLLEIVFPGSSVKVRAAILAFASVAAPIIMGRRPLVDWLWPEPPEILDLALFRQDVYPDDPRLAGRPFIGREEELRALMRFAGADGGETPRWYALTAPHGIGKTRLALEWLERLPKRNWDAGVLDPGATVADIEKAHFRRNTAIVIDGALKDKDLWPKLDALLTPRRRVRILVIDQAPIRPPETLAKAMRDRIETTQLAGLRIERLDRDALAAIAPEAESSTLDRADGRPLYVLLGPDPAATVARRVAERFEVAGQPGEKAFLAFAALAGPVENLVWQRHLVDNPSLSHRARLFGGVDRDTLKRTLPALAPEPFADALLLAWAMEQDEATWDKLFQSAIAANPSAVIARLRSLWTGPPLKPEEAEAREALQHLFDKARPDLVEAMREEAWCAGARTTEPTDQNALDDALAELAAVADGRPFDREFQLWTAKGAVNAILHYGTKGRWTDLERWGKRLKAVADAWPRDRDIQLEEAAGAVNAIRDYGAKGQWTDLERWGDRLMAVTHAETWQEDREIQLEEATGAVHAVAGYGAKGCWEDLERWGDRLKAVALAEAWQKDPEIQNREVAGAVNAIRNYGAEGRWTDLERWGDRLKTIAEAWPDDQEIQLAETKGAVNAIDAYGVQACWEDLERWGKRLKVVANGWRDDWEIQLHEAIGAVNAISCYGAKRRLAEVKRWGERLTVVAHAEAWQKNQEIQLQEATGAVHAISCYGAQGCWTELEEWGKRLKAVAEAWRRDPEIQRLEAMGAVNAIDHYGRMRLWADLERWGGRLKTIAEAWPDDQEIQLREVEGAFNAINHYGGQARPHDLKRWRERVAAVARAHPGNLGIQEAASKLGLSYADQMRASGHNVWL